MTGKYDQFEPNDANFVPLTPLSFIKRVDMMFGDRPSIVYGNRRYTWSDTYKRCRQLASALQRAGVQKGDTVSILSPNTPEMMEAHFGVAMSGAVLNTINTRLDADTIAYILDHGEAQVFMVDGALSPEAIKAIAMVDNKDLQIIDICDEQASIPPVPVGKMDYEAFLETGDPDFDWEMPTSEWDAMCLNYTSGTSGRPKGVVYHHRGSYLIAMGTIADWPLPKHPTYLYTVPLFHCNGWGHVWAMAAVAGTMVCTREISAAKIFDAISTEKVSHFGGAPIVLSMILNAPESDRKSFDHHVEVMTAGAPPPAAVLQGIEGMGFNVTQVYGLTETYGHTVMCTWNTDWDGLNDTDRAEIKARQGAFMVFMEGLRVVGEDGKDVPADGETMGELYLRGNTVMKGYLKNADATEESFKGGWFHTGDIAVMHPRGYAQIKDRLKDIIISGGENISSVEIEGVLHRHPSVALAAVVAKQDDKWGEVPCAFIELKDGATATEDEIISFCRENMAGFKRPKKVVFGELPKTATGKIQKFELRKQV